ncbi:MAG: alpha/beta hydrolase [Verrucomicrobia bacterium]|nr:alpha/beta hydrolase [Verrucomicrobiota bacterium]
MDIPKYPFTGTMRTSYSAIVLTFVFINLLIGSATAETLKDLPYKTGPGLTKYEKERCRVDLYLPNGKKQFPTLVWFHGGGLRNGDKGSKAALVVAHRMLSHGIAVASANYRLSPKVKFPTYIEDSAAVTQWVTETIAHYGGDPNKVFVGGHSAGGYLALMLALDAHYLADTGLDPQTIAGYVPVSGQTVVHSTIIEERNMTKGKVLVDEAAPLYHISKNTPPILILAGDNDNPARLEENQLLIAKLKAAGHPSAELFIGEDRTHGSIITSMGQEDDGVALAAVNFIGLN